MTKRKVDRETVLKVCKVLGVVLVCAIAFAYAHSFYGFPLQKARENLIFLEHSPHFCKIFFGIFISQGAKKAGQRLPVCFICPAGFWPSGGGACANTGRSSLPKPCRRR